MNDDLFWMSAADLLKHYASAELSPVEVAEAVLSRIEQLHAEVNTFVHVDPEATLACCCRR